MKQRRQNSHSIDFLFVILAFLMYAGAMITLVYMGAQVYQSVTVKRDRHYAEGTAQAYITEKVRQNDRAGSIWVEQIEGQNVLALRQTIEGQDYITYIYSYDKGLRELFARADREVSLADGTEIFRLGGFSVEEVQGGFLKGSITEEEGFTRTFWIHRESSET